MKGKKRSQQRTMPETGGPATTDNAPAFRDRLGDLAQRFDYLLLFLFVYLVYNTVTRMTMSGDTNPAAFLPLALIMHQTVYFDTFVGAGLGPGIAYAFPLVNGHYVSLFPIVTPVLITPVYGVSYLLYTALQVPLDIMSIMIIAKTSATIIAALSCVFVYLVAKELFPKRIALVTALVYAFATSTWSVSSQALWQHGTVELLLILMLYIVIRNEREPSPKKIILLGILSGLFVFNRPPDAVLLLPIIGYAVWYERKNLPVYALSAVAAGLPFLVYNVLIFGNVFGGYQQNLSLFEPGPGCIVNFAGLLIAPNVGLLVFSPVLVLSILGYLKLGSVPGERVRQVLVLFGPAIILEIGVYSLFGLWASSLAFSFGQRFLTGFVPVLAIFTGIVINASFSGGDKTAGTRIVRYCIILLILSSVFIQAIGVFLYPLRPDRSNTSEGIWDVNHLLVVETFQYGITRIDSVTLYSFPPLPPLFSWQSAGTAGSSPPV